MSTGHPYLLRYTGPGKSPHGTFWSEDLKESRCSPYVRGATCWCWSFGLCFCTGRWNGRCQDYLPGTISDRDGRPIATPYCEDSNVAAVARSTE